MPPNDKPDKYWEVVKMEIVGSGPIRLIRDDFAIQGVWATSIDWIEIGDQFKPRLRASLAYLELTTGIKIPVDILQLLIDESFVVKENSAASGGGVLLMLEQRKDSPIVASAMSKPAKSSAREIPKASASVPWWKFWKNPKGPNASSHEEAPAAGISPGTENTAKPQDRPTMSAVTAAGFLINSSPTRDENVFETGEKNPQRIVCSDDECPCTDAKLLTIGSTAYLYISQAVVGNRRNCRTLLQLDNYLKTVARKLDANVFALGGIYNPFYLCETGAKLRNLNLEAALADAKLVAETGFAPLRESRRLTGPATATPADLQRTKTHAVGVRKETVRTAALRADFSSTRKNASPVTPHASAFVSVVNRRSFDEIRLLITGNRKLVFARDEKEWTALHHVAFGGRRDLIELLASAGADVNAKNDRGRTPLFLAADKGYGNAVGWLISYSAEVNIVDKDGWTPLHLAAENGHTYVVKLLLAYKAQIDAKGYDDNTPLLLACAKGHRAIVKVLLKGEADVNAGNKDGFRPMHAAAAGGHRSIVGMLFARGANVNARSGRGSTPTDLATSKGHKEVTALLLSKNAILSPGAGRNDSPVDQRTALGARPANAANPTHAMRPTAYWSAANRLPSVQKLKADDIILCARVVGYSCVRGFKDDPKFLGHSRLCTRIGVMLAMRESLSVDIFVELVTESQREALAMEPKNRTEFVDAGLVGLERYLAEFNGRPYSEAEQKLQFELMKDLANRQA